MSQVDDMREIRISPPPRTAEFGLPYSPLPPAKKRRKETLVSWAEVGPTLSPSTQELAEKFVYTCERKGLFYCDPGCRIDGIDDDQIMFDWNNGQFPIFTVLIGSDHPPVVFVGKFKEGKITGETTTLELLESPLDRLVQEIGNPLWTPTFSPDLSTHIANVVPALGEQPSILLPRPEDSLSLPQIMHLGRSSQTQDVM